MKNHIPTGIFLAAKTRLKFIDGISRDAKGAIQTVVIFGFNAADQRLV